MLEYMLGLGETESGSLLEERMKILRMEWDSNSEHKTKDSGLPLCAEMPWKSSEHGNKVSLRIS